MQRASLAAVLALLAGCSDQPKSQASSQTAAAFPTKEGFLDVPDGRVWYRVSGAGPATPVILLHGGPGYSSFYLKLLDSLGFDRPTIRYDQLGGGKSTRTTDTLLATIPHFVAELDSVRRALGASQVYLLGHSWGTILAVEYYRAHPDNVAGLILGSAALDIPEWERHAKELVKTLPDSSQRAIRQAEQSGDFAAADYQAALGEFYGRYVWRRPNEAELDSTLQTVNEGIYNYMQGPSEFTIVGTLKHYDATSFLSQIRVPTLYTVGEFDEANPVTVRRFSELTPGAQVVVIPGAAHITTWDNPTAMLSAVRTFLQHADSVRAAAR
jgi:proline iminopeptidase